jgi:hypothetical protein
MNFFINQYSTLPRLKMKLVSNNDLDLDQFEELLSISTVTFSMVDADTGIFRISNKAGSIESKKSASNPLINEYTIVYEWTKNDTAKVGNYIGEFKLDFLGECSSLIVPIAEKLNIFIQGSITKTTTQKI